MQGDLKQPVVLKHSRDTLIRFLGYKERWGVGEPHKMQISLSARDEATSSPCSQTAPALNLKMADYHPHFHFSPDTAEPVNHGGSGLDQACVDGHP